MKPYCFVLMPFGRKTDETGRSVDFDSIYGEIIEPAIAEAELEPIRADEEIIGGIIHKPMFERLMLCDYAVADLTTANANVFYELGVRHGVRPYSTVPVAASGMRLPFDVAPLRAIMYELDAAGIPVDSKTVRASLTERLVSCRNPSDDSPLYQLVQDLPRIDIQRLKTDTFRDVVEYSQELKARLRDARSKGPEAVAAVQNQVNVVDADPAVVIDILLSYRAVKDWKKMVDLVEDMSAPLQRTILVQEQLGFALNRLGRADAAERVLKDVIQEHGPSSKTNGLLGRVYKDQWEQARERGDLAASGYLQKAISAYLEGFEADWRDAYPGINAVTLMDCSDPPDPRQEELLPVVAYAVQRRMAGKHPDYWDYATVLELAVLRDRREDAEKYLGLALSFVREQWEPETTAKNIAMIRRSRETQGRDVGWIQTIETQLKAATTG